MFEDFVHVGHVLNYPKKRYYLPCDLRSISEEIPAEEMPEQGIPPDG